MRLSLLVGFTVFIMTCACAPFSGGSDRSKDPQAVVNVTWQWVSTVTPAEKVDVPAPARYTVLLTPDGKAQMLFDCNRGGGDYQLSPGKLSFGPLISTRMACPEDSLDGLFMRDLQQVASFFMDNGLLFMELPDDRGTLKFRPAP